jgi:hypothetical protein
MAEATGLGVHACTKCGQMGGLKHCARCKQVWYCSAECQKTNWNRQHKSNCKFIVATNDKQLGDALSLLKRVASPPFMSLGNTEDGSSAGIKFFGIADIHMAVLSLLPAKDLLAAQGVCRFWFRAVALERSCNSDCSSRQGLAS